MRNYYSVTISSVVGDWISKLNIDFINHQYSWTWNCRRIWCQKTSMKYSSSVENILRVSLMFFLMLGSQINIFPYAVFVLHIHGLVQKRCNSIANALELSLPCTNQSIYVVYTILAHIFQCSFTGINHRARHVILRDIADDVFTLIP